RRGSIVIQYLADRPCWRESGKTRKVYSCLGVSYALQHATLSSTKGMDMTGTNQVVSRGGGVHRHTNGRCPVACADAGGNPEARCSIYADRERGSQRLTIVICLRKQPKALHPFGRERKADHAFRAKHEVHHLRRDELRRADKVALVLAVLIIGHHHETALPNVLDRLLHRAERHLHFILRADAPVSVRLPVSPDAAPPADGRTSLSRPLPDALRHRAPDGRVWCA